jgi:hypothetical protein
MSYRFCDGKNWIWNAPASKPEPGVYPNWGGDKTFLGPHPAWKLFVDKMWPPQPAWDGAEHQAEMPTPDKLRTVSPVWPGFEARVIRTYSFAADGDFVIEQTVEKIGGEPVFISIWDVTQAATPDAVYLPVNPESPYAGGFYWLGAKRPSDTHIEGGLLQIKPQPGVSYKIGADSPVAAIAAIKAGDAWIQRTHRIEGQSYPDGASGAGFPVEFYNHEAAGSAHYVELELLSPVWKFSAETRRTQTVRWSLQHLPTPVPDPAGSAETISQLLRRELPR